MLAAACGPAGEESADAAAGDSDPTDTVVRGCLAGAEPYVRGRLYGSVEMPLDWTGPGLACEGMPRPGEAGLRLRFARKMTPGREHIVLIIGIAGVAPDEKAEARPATITIIDERNDRFFSNAGENCWADVLEQAKVPDAPLSRAVTGRIYCTAAVAAVTGAGSVSLDEIEFRGRVDWPDTAFPAPAP